MSAKCGLAGRGVILLELDAFSFFFLLLSISPLVWKLTISFLLSRVNICPPAPLADGCIGFILAVEIFNFFGTAR